MIRSQKRGDSNMKTVLIITMGSTTEVFLREYLERTIGKVAIVESARCHDVESVEGFDVVVFSSHQGYSLTKSRIDVSIPYVICERVVDHKNLAEIIAIPENSEVLLVNDYDSTAKEAASQLESLGLDHFNTTLYYPGKAIQNFSRFDFALTPGEEQLVPCEIKKVINIGTRIVAIKTIHEIIETLQVGELFKQKLTERYVRDIVNVMKKIDVKRHQLKKSENLLGSIINSVEQGIVCIDYDYCISQINSKMAHILGMHTKDLLGKALSKAMDVDDIEPFLRASQVIELNGGQYLCVASEVVDEAERRFVITFENTSRLRHKDIKLKEYYRGKKHRPLHSFSDFVTLNDNNLDLIEKAKRFAQTESNILIIGENGTGKEIMAQSIHSHSRHSEKPFVPINITAISESLLESELFGYEPGAFTGADKNGKVGIFEKAEGGTVFIDEIGDASLSIQARLLRVIQEKRIRRVGGHEEVPIDVRIVSATNKNLHQMVKDQLFREDLYYRLNVLPIYTIPLRKRPEDIMYLLERFLQPYLLKFDLNMESLFDKDVLEIIENYKWPGNVRELLNFTEYVQAVYRGERLTVLDLPEHLMTEIQSFDYHKLEYIEYKVLEKLTADSYSGRRSISMELQKCGINASEGQVRSVFKTLSENNLIECVDRKGARLTIQGLGIYKKYETKNIW